MVRDSNSSTSQFVMGEPSNAFPREHERKYKFTFVYLF